MKKTILSIAFIAFSATSLFSQIPNNGFESWTTVGTNSTPDNWETMNNYTAPTGVYTATKGMPGSPGASYLALTTKTISSTIVNGIAVCGKLDPVTMLPVSGFPYTQQPAKFTGNWQHMIFGTSQGKVSVTLSKWNTTTNSRDIIATADQTLSGMAMSWAAFSINFNYVSSLVPDSCIIFLKASGGVPTNLDYLWVDNLAFSGSVVGINEMGNSISKIALYPNPATDKITIELSNESSSSIKLQLVDILGRIIKEVNDTDVTSNKKYSIETNDVTKGSYFLKITTNSGVQVNKIEIQ